MSDVLESGDGVTVVRVDTRAGLEQAWDVRLEVFVTEQQVPLEEEVDDLDTASTTTHVLAVDDAGGRAIGTGRLLSDPDHPGEVHLGRLAVRAEARGRGIGARLVVAIEALALAEHAVDPGSDASVGTTGPVATTDTGNSDPANAAGAGTSRPANATDAGTSHPANATGTGLSGSNAGGGPLAVTVVLSAQESALDFYRRLGYAVVSGERYLDAGIWHQDMARTVTS